jgi:hypothetical protein
VIDRDMEAAIDLYAKLAAEVLPKRGEGGRRAPPSSRPPLQIDPVSLMTELEQALARWNARAQWLLSIERGG